MPTTVHRRDRRRLVHHRIAKKEKMTKSQYYGQILLVIAIIGALTVAAFYAA